MSKDNKKWRPVVLALVISVAIGVVPVQAFASMRDSRYGSSLSEYQVILDKCNAEFGTSFKFITQVEVDWAHDRIIEQLGYLPEGGPKVTTVEDLGTFGEFERIMRADCALQAAYDREAERLRNEEMQELFEQSSFVNGISSIGGSGSPSRGTSY